MANQRYIASGQVIDSRTKQGVPGLRVEAWDKDQKYNDFLGVAITDRSGRFRISFDETYFREYAPDTSPDLFFKVYRGQKLIKSTEDSVIWNAETATELTIDLDMPDRQPVGNDRITARQVFRGVDFVQRSDFRGLLKEANDKTGAVFGVVTDMVKNTITNMDIEPLKVGPHKTNDVINQDVDSARKNLEAQQVMVNEVKPYKPGLNAESVADIAAFPVRLKPDQKVNLYEENGKVRYYTIVKEKKPEDINASDVVTLNNEVKTVSSKLRELDTIKTEFSTLKVSLETSKGEVVKEFDSMKTQLDKFDKMKNELETTKKESTKKDQQLAALQREVESLRVAQSEIMKQVPSGTIDRIKQDIKELQEFNAKKKKTSKKSRKSSPDTGKKS